jgi:hypothetical protein
MTTLYQSLWILAVRRQGMGAGFRGENNDYDLTPFLVFVCVLAAIVGALFLLDRWIRRYNRLKMYNSPTELFRQLCQTHELARHESHQLKQLATHWQLSHPATLFVEPDYFRPDKLPADWFDRTSQIEQIHRKLFDAL